MTSGSFSRPELGRLSSGDSSVPSPYSLSRFLRIYLNENNKQRYLGQVLLLVSILEIMRKEVELRIPTYYTLEYLTMLHGVPGFVYNEITWRLLQKCSKNVV